MYTTGDPHLADGPISWFTVVHPGAKSTSGGLYPPIASDEDPTSKIETDQAILPPYNFTFHDLIARWDLLFNYGTKMPKDALFSAILHWIHSHGLGASWKSYGQKHGQFNATYQLIRNEYVNKHFKNMFLWFYPILSIIVHW